VQLSKILYLKGNGYRSVSGPSYLKSYSSVTCNVTVAHDECIVECGDGHGSRLNGTGSGLKPNFAGSGLDRTTVFF